MDFQKPSGSEKFNLCVKRISWRWRISGVITSNERSSIFFIRVCWVFIFCFRNLWPNYSFQFWGEKLRVFPWNTQRNSWKENWSLATKSATEFKKLIFFHCFLTTILTIHWLISWWTNQKNWPIRFISPLQSVILRNIDLFHLLAK